jgi:hypothetical protein
MRLIGARQITGQLQIIRRISKNQINRLVGNLAQFGDAIAL